MTENYILEARNLNKTFTQGERQIEVFKNLNLNLRPGESLAILGPSGSGKSTLLSLLAGLDKPTAGSVLFESRSLSDLSQDDLATLRRYSVAMIFQQFHLFQHLTALENVAIPLEIQGREDGQAVATQLLTQVGLGDRLHHFPSQLSGGECQRVAIARAMSTQPKLILADEPSGNLDIHTGDQVMNLLFELVRANKTSLVLVTHNLHLAERCNRIFRFPEDLA